MAQKVVVISPENECYLKDRLSAWSASLPLLYTHGNLDLLEMPLTAIFCSRKCPGDAILKAYDLARELREKQIPVISGFHTPVEKDMLEILLKGKGPIVICPARGVEGMRISPAVSRAIAEGRVLLLSLFNQLDKRIIKDHCETRNNLVVALTRKVIFIYHDPDGSLTPLYRSILGADKLG